MRVRSIGRGLAAAALLIVAAPGTASAGPEPPPDGLFIYARLPDHTIATGSSGKMVRVWIDQNYTYEPELGLDVAGLATVATVDFPPECDVTGARATCRLREDARFVELRLRPVTAAAPGTVGRLTYEVWASNIQSDGPRTATVTVGSGADLVGLSATEVGEAARPGQRLNAPFRFYNAGGTPVHGFDFVAVFTNGLLPTPRRGCSIGPADEPHRTQLRCRVDATVPPGGEESARTVTLPAVLKTDAYGWEGVDVSVQPAAGRDLDDTDNDGYHVLTDVKNSFDFAATGGSASGARNRTVDMTFGIISRGVGTVDTRGDGVHPGMWVQIPQGTRAVGVPGDCGIPVYADDGTLYDILLGQTGGNLYLCYGQGFWRRGDSYPYTFRLRIDRATVSPGWASVMDPVREYPSWHDDNSGNDKAPLVVRVTR